MVKFYVIVFQKYNLAILAAKLVCFRLNSRHVTILSKVPNPFHLNWRDVFTYLVRTGYYLQFIFYEHKYCIIAYISFFAYYQRKNKKRERNETYYAAQK